MAMYLSLNRWVATNGVEAHLDSHVHRVGATCRILALAAGQTEDWAQTLEVASRFHDLGKIGIPDHILSKPGKLNQLELEIVRQHPEIGADIIPDHPNAVAKMARETALTHHEHWDGSGYPNGLRGDEIPLSGRITAICDVYDALLAERSYKRAWTHERAVEQIRSDSGKMFDPSLTRLFISVLQEIDWARERYQVLEDRSSAPTPSRNSGSLELARLATASAVSRDGSQALHLRVLPPRRQVT